MPPQLTNITSPTERDAAGLGLDLPIASTNVLGLLRQYWRAFQERRQHQSLAYLSDRELMDIGLRRDEIDYMPPQRAIDRIRDSAMYLLSRGG